MLNKLSNTEMEDISGTNVQVCFMLIFFRNKYDANKY